MKRSWVCAIGCIIMSLPISAAFADEARQVFDSLYGQKIKQAAATSDRADDIALAKEMLAVAKASGSTPKLQAMLCDTAGDLGSKHPDGFSTAIEAMQLLADAQEDQREATRVKLIDLLTKQSRTGKAEERTQASDAMIDLLIAMGDEKAEKKQYAEAAVDYRRAFILATQRKSDLLNVVKAKMEFAVSRDRAVTQIARLREKLLQNANDHATAEEIVKLYVVELDEPTAALPFINRVKDERLKRFVPLAIRPASELSATDCLELAQTYVAWSREQGKADKIHLWGKAARLLEEYLKVHTADDLSRRQADVLLSEAQAKLAAANSEAVTAEPIRLQGHTQPVSVARFSPDGKSIITGSADGSVRVWNARTGKNLSSIESLGHVYNARLTTGNSAIVGLGEMLGVFDLKTGRRIGERKISDESFAGRIDATADGRMIASGSYYWFRITDGRTFAELYSSNISSYATALSQAGDMAVVGGENKVIIVYDTKTWREQARLKGSTDHIYGLAISRNGNIAASCCKDGSVGVWNLKTGKLERSFNEFQRPGRIAYVSLSDDGRRVLAQTGREVMVWDAVSGTRLESWTDVVGIADMAGDGGRVVIPSGNEATVRTLR